MKRWQELISEHGHDIKVLDDNTMIVFNASWNPETKEYFNDKINRNKYGYDVEELDTNNNIINISNYDSVLEYLGY